MEKVAILGAGITGLFLAHKLSNKFSVTLIEKEKQIGGMSGSFKHKNFFLDYGPHKIYTELSGIIPEIENLVELDRIKKINSIYLENYYFNFPLSLPQLLTKIPIKGFQAGIDIIFNLISKKPNINYENFLINNFGNTLYSLVFKKYAKKIWANPKSLDIDLAKKRVAVSNIFELIKSVILKENKKISAEYFFYPKISISELIYSLEEKIKKNKGKILLNKKIKKIETGKKIKIKINNKTTSFDYLVSTIPLSDLSEYLDNDELIENSKKLRYKDTNIFYFIIKKQRVLRENWIFFPDLDIPFHRIAEQKSFSNKSCPENETCLMVESTLDKEKQEEITDKLIELNFFKKEEIKEVFSKKLEKAYPLYFIDYQNYLKNILSYFDNLENIYLLGRHGLFNYNNMDQCIDMSLKLSDHLINNKTKKQWKETRKLFDKYRIVD